MMRSQLTSGWSEGWESNPLTQRERIYSPPRLSDCAALRNKCSPKPFCADTHYLVSWLGGLLYFLIHQLEGARLVSYRAGETENILVFVFRTTLTNFSLAIRYS